MTTLREAAQQALEALESGVSLKLGWMPDCEDAITALKAALADGDNLSPGEPVQEPVAWRWGYRSITTGEMDWRGYVEIPAHPNLRSPEIIMEPLYTAPPQRKPLTDEEIADMWVGILYDSPPSGVHEDGLVPHRLARAIERAHGIGEKP